MFTHSFEKYSMLDQKKMKKFHGVWMERKIPDRMVKKYRREYVKDQTYNAFKTGVGSGSFMGVQNTLHNKEEKGLKNKAKSFGKGFLFGFAPVFAGGAAAPHALSKKDAKTMLKFDTARHTLNSPKHNAMHLGMFNEVYLAPEVEKLQRAREKAMFLPGKKHHAAKAIGALAGEVALGAVNKKEKENK
jgi:hypothetical protein